jgi:hypothetical protein
MALSKVIFLQDLRDKVVFVFPWFKYLRDIEDFEIGKPPHQR